MELKDLQKVNVRLAAILEVDSVQVNLQDSIKLVLGQLLLYALLNY